MDNVQLKLYWVYYNNVFVSICSPVLHFVEPGFQDKKVIILEVMWLELEVVVDHSLCECTVVYVTCE